MHRHRFKSSGWPAKRLATPGIRRSVVFLNDGSQRMNLTAEAAGLSPYTFDENGALLETQLPLPRRSGKVRDIYDLGQELLIVSTDRISAFDYILPAEFRKRADC